MRKCLKEIEDRNKKHNCTPVGGRSLFLLSTYGAPRQRSSL